MENISIVHNYREANAVVDRLASDAMVFLERKEWVSKLVEHLLELAVVDSAHEDIIAF